SAGLRPTPSSPLRLNTGRALKPLPPLAYEPEGTLAFGNSDFSRIQISKMSNQSHDEAFQWIYKRVFDVERLYQTQSDPYFGGSLSEKCDFAYHSPHQPETRSIDLYARFDSLASERFAVGDCVRAHNPLQVRMEWVYCEQEKTAYEVRF